MSAPTCHLPTAAKPGRRAHLQHLFSSHRPRTEATDRRVILTFDDPGLVTALAEIVAFERRCCPALSFRLSVPAGADTTILEIEGASGTRDFVAQWLPDSTDLIDPIDPIDPADPTDSTDPSDPTPDLPAERSSTALNRRQRDRCARRSRSTRLLRRPRRSGGGYGGGAAARRARWDRDRAARCGDRPRRHGVVAVAERIHDTALARRIGDTATMRSGPSGRCGSVRRCRRDRSHRGPATLLVGVSGATPLTPGGAGKTGSAPRWVA